MELIIKYENAKGETSERNIDVLSQDGGLLKAHCHMRDRLRTFRFDRISSVFDAETGEELSIDDIRQTFMGLTEGGIEALPETANSGLKFLMALAAADGVISEEEIQAICSFVCNHPDCEHLDVDKLISMVHELQFEEIDDPTKTVDLQKRFGGSSYRHFYRAVRQVADADGKLKEEEVKFLLEN